MSSPSEALIQNELAKLRVAKLRACNHGAAQSVSMEACLVARCCTVRVSTSFRMLVHFIRFLCRHGLVDASTENENKWVTMIVMMMMIMIQ